MVSIKSFSPDTSPVPNYLKSAEFDGGQYTWAQYGSSVPKGKIAKLWNPKVRDRFAALFAALGNRYNSHPYFEGITINETALGNAIPRMSAVQEEGWFDNLATVHQRMRAAFPNTVTIQYLNYPRDQLGEIINKFKQSDTGIGCPDVFLEDKGLHATNNSPGLYYYYRNNRGTLPLMVQVEHANYLNTRHDNKGFKPTVNQLLSFARDELDVNYIFWTRQKGYYDKVLELLDFRQQKQNASGGLRAACPTAFADCKTN